MYYKGWIKYFVIVIIICSSEAHFISWRVIGCCMPVSIRSVGGPAWGSLTQMFADVSVIGSEGPFSSSEYLVPHWSSTTRLSLLMLPSVIITCHITLECRSLPISILPTYFQNSLPFSCCKARISSCVLHQWLLLAFCTAVSSVFCLAHLVALSLCFLVPLALNHYLSVSLKSLYNSSNSAFQ